MEIFGKERVNIHIQYLTIGVSESSMEGRGHALQACHAMHGRHQCCGSGMFIQDPRFFSIPDTDATKKRRWKN
jgi:hypothetical protein